MAHDLIINCPNTCKNNCPACYLKVLGMNSFVSDYHGFNMNLLTHLMYQEIPYDNIHLFSVNGSVEWNRTMVSVLVELERQKKILNDVYLYFKYDDLESMKDIARNIWHMRGGNIIDKPTSFNKFKLAYSIIDPHKHPHSYSDEITRMTKLFLGYCDGGIASGDSNIGCMLTYTFTNDFILSLNPELIGRLQDNIKQQVYSLSQIGINDVSIAISIAKPYSKDPIEVRHAFKLLTSVFKNLSCTPFGEVSVPLLMDYCFMNYMNAKFLTTEGKASIIGVYEDCDVITPQGSAFIQNKCPYTTLNIRSCDKCPIKEGITNE